MIPLTWPTITELDRQAVNNAAANLEDDGYLVHAFEQEFAAHLDCIDAVAVNSGTAALRILLEITRTGEHFAVTVPSYTCRSLLNAVGAPFLADNESNVTTADYNARGRAIGNLVVTETFGKPTPHHAAIAIRDITHAPVANKHPANIVCSFARDKMITTQRGGIIASNDHSLIEACREYAHYEHRDNYPIYTRAESAGMTDLQAALGRSQLQQLPGFIERRHEIATTYSKAFQNAGIPCPDPDCGSLFWRYIIQTPDAAHTVRELAQHGIEAGRGVNPPLHRLLDLDPDGYPGAEYAWKHNVSVPIYPTLTKSHIRHITQTVLKTCAPSPSSKPA